MSVNFQSPLTSENTNSAFVSRTQDTSMIGQLDNQNATDSNSTSTGAIKTAGGLGVQKKAHINQVFVDSLSGSKALVTSAFKEIVESTVTADEIQELSGITGNVQSLIDTKANDGTVVHLTGDETIAGQKTFVDDLQVNSNLVVDGNLTVNGTTTTLNTQNLDIEDTNVTINKSGTDATSQGAGLTVDREGAKGSLVYDSSLASRWKAGDFSSESEVITAATSQLITGAKSFFNVTVNADFTFNQIIDGGPSGVDAKVETPAAIVRLTNASLVSIASIDDVKPGKIVIITNRTGNVVTVKDNVGSPATLGIRTGSNEDFELENNGSILVSYDSLSQRWYLIGGTGGGKQTVGFQETPGGPVNGVNTNFGPLSFAPANEDSIIVFVDGIALKNDEWSLSGLSVVLNVAPTLGQTVYVFYVTTGVPSSTPAPTGTWVTEFRTVTAGEATAKQLTLTSAPGNPAHVLVDIIGGTAQEFNVDYTISGSDFVWSGYNLDSTLGLGDKIRFAYLS